MSEKTKDGREPQESKRKEKWPKAKKNKRNEGKKKRPKA